MSALPDPPASPEASGEAEASADKRAWARELVGTTVAERFRLERLIEVGGMGAVFEAAELDTHAKVAIKVLVPGLVHTPHAVERLRREAMRASSVDDPGVVRVLDLVTDAELGPCLVMELLRGESLAQRLERTSRLEVDDAVAVTLDVLRILEAVHARSILHRDLKPGNLFFARTDDGEVVKLLDFGLARSLTGADDEATLTLPGTVVGTPRYMAPEQARAQREIDHRVDLYSVGALLYRMLSGQTPYADWSSREVILAVRAGPCAPLRQVMPDAPRALAEVADRAMRTAPEERFPDAAAMASALRAALAARPSVYPAGDDETMEERVTLQSVVPSSPPERARWPLRAAVGAALTLALAAGAFFWVRAQPSDGRASPPVEPMPPVASAPADPSTSRDPEVAEPTPEPAPEASDPTVPDPTVPDPTVPDPTVPDPPSTDPTEADAPAAEAAVPAPAAPTGRRTRRAPVDDVPEAEGRSGRLRRDEF
ncbi:MAG: serine/threonine protein kinase [Myxococcales bacterium]|nr:serine/threonine protein kinase [Myxococcales bacterium]